MRLMTATQFQPTTADEARAEMIAQGTADSRVADAMALFQTVSQLVPVPAAHFSPVKYSSSGNHI